MTLSSAGTETYMKDFFFWGGGGGLMSGYTFQVI
jgi:hypothetical protein